MKAFTLIFSMIMSVTAFGQTFNQSGQPVAKIVSNDDRMSVIGESIIEVPASNVKFTITLNTSDTASMDASYNKHRESEDKLVKLFRKFNIPDKNITYSLPSLSLYPGSKTYTPKYIETPPQYNVQQQISFIIDNVKQTTEIEELLIEDGFNNFRSEFLLKNLEQYKSESIEKAVANAKEKANLLAKLSDRKIKRTIKVIAYEENGRGGSLSYVPQVSYSASMESLTEIGQTVKITKRVSVDFELEQ